VCDIFPFQAFFLTTNHHDCDPRPSALTSRFLSTTELLFVVPDTDLGFPCSLWILSSFVIAKQEGFENRMDVTMGVSTIEHYDYRPLFGKSYHSSQQ
jgi:hypothetical protein